MNKKAIDIVLLPSEEMMDKAIAINRRLLERGESNMTLNKHNCFPHISILMGCMEDKDLPKMSTILQNIALQYAIFRLQITEVQHENGSTVLNTNKDPRLHSLHQTIIDQIAPLLTYDASAEMLYNPAEIGEKALHYINHFLTNASYGKYSPHITVGNGMYTDSIFPLPFTAATLALCHLGSYCTCREILFQVQLMDKFSAKKT